VSNVDEMWEMQFRVKLVGNEIEDLVSVPHNRLGSASVMRIKFLLRNLKKIHGWENSMRILEGVVLERVINVGCISRDRSRECDK
jgi:hypothetical protein